MNVYVPGLVGALLILLLMVELLRRERLSEKYAVLWLFVGVVITVIAAVPPVLYHAASALGVKTPSNLLFLLASTTLLLVCVHLSCETSRLEDETRSLAEEVALLRLKVDEQAGRAEAR